MEGDGCLVAEMAVSCLVFWMQIESMFSAHLGVHLMLVEVIVYQTNLQHGLSLIGQVRRWYLLLSIFSRRRHPVDIKIAANHVAD